MAVHRPLMGTVRRSGRISRKVPILLLGTNTSGRVFSEKTTTLVLSRHGAGILSSHKLASDETLTVRLLGSSREAEVRLVGYLGQRNAAHVYGIAFLNEDVNFWQVEFPPGPGAEASPSAVILECELCGSRAPVQQSDIEADVYAVNHSVLRYCERCGSSTSWRPAGPEAQPARQESAPVPPRAAPEPVRTESAVSAPYSGMRTEEVVSNSSWPVATAVLDKPPSPPASSDTSRAAGKAARPANRRRDVRTSVNFTACVRHAVSGDEIVECDNISKGGLSFRSRRHYPEDSAIEVAVPYSPGAPAIFVHAQIRHAEEVSAHLFRYGVAYVKSPSCSSQRVYEA